jgi:glutamate synthase domain-containing protein 3
MTGGTVVVLGRTGRNFAAGMSGGMAYVYDEDGTFAERCNTSMVTLERVLPEPEQLRAESELAAAGKGRVLHAGQSDEAQLRTLIERHLRFTGSTRALAILDHWDETRGRFAKVFPHEYRRALGEQHAAQPRVDRNAANRQKAAA